MIYFKNGAVSEDHLSNASSFYLSNYEKEALQFCIEWKSGKDVFSFETSGSTGKPKIIQLKRTFMAASAERTRQALRLNKGETIFVCLNIKYIAGQMMLVRGLETGMDMVIAEPSTHPFDDISKTLKFDFISLVPLQMEQLLNNPQTFSILDNAKNILLGGAAVSEDLISKIQSLNSSVYASFGMTETASHIALRRLNGIEKSENYFTLEGIHVGQDDRGCLVIVMDSEGQEFVTNDLVELVSEKEFRWIGRIDNIINSGGVKVSAELLETEVASVFAKLQLGRNFFICGLPDNRLGEMVSLIIEGDPLPQETEMRIKTSLSGLLAQYKVPKKILYIPVILTTNNKIDRKGNRKILLQ